MFSLLKRCCPLVFALVVLVASVACSDGSRLAIGDVIQVAVDGERDLSKSYQINKDGCITMSQVNPVKLVDLNTSEAEFEITRALSTILVNPQTTVTYTVGARLQVFVVGQVTRRGAVEIGVGDKVMQALSMAGYDDTADLSRVNIRRGDQIINLDLRKYLSGQDLAVNAELKSNDTVVVPRMDMVGLVMVLGQATKVGPVPLKEGMTFREVMGLIGGTTVEADMEKITIKRNGIADPIPVKYKQAMDGDPTADVALQPNDTIYIPQIETAFFTVLGGVSRPGQYPLKGKLTLSEAIGLAGGAVPNLGDLRKVQLMRPAVGDAKAPSTVTIDLVKVIKTAAEETLVKRGDVIVVAQHKDKTNVLQVLQTLMPFGWLFR
jgi:protein involved in polysaccharide export with SLBB domain